MTTHVTDVHVQDEDSLAELITPRASPYDCMVEIDGNMAYKVTVLKKLTASNPLTCDRLTTYHGQDSYMDLDNIVYVDDQIFINPTQTVPDKNLNVRGRQETW